MRILEYIKLIRVHQWYKNLLIFLPMIFVGELFIKEIWGVMLLGFVALCLISSSNYVLNDIIDVKRDRAHPEKKSRPLALGKVSIIEAIIISLIFLGASIFIAYSLGIGFLACIIFLFLFTLFYSLFLKKEPVADVIAIAINFVIRAVSGAFILKVMISPWIIVCPFFLALFLAVGKRDADLRFMKGNASKHKEVLKHYNLELTNTMMIISTTCLVIAYSLYSFSRTALLLLTLPFAIYAIFRYYSLVINGSEIARHPEKVYKDWRLVIIGALWAILVFAIFYLILGKIDLGFLIR